VQILAADVDKKDRALTALILNQYRLKVAQKYRINLKPVILMKSKTIAESVEFEEIFHTMIKNLTIQDLERIKNQNKGKNNIIERAFNFFDDKKIDLENLLIEIKEDFKEENTISVNSKNDSEEKQLIINSLEDENNHIRVVFAVDKLNEGWDVLNLFDIVRLYTTRDGRNGKPGKTTMAEAQLIGRGARYYPFEWNGLNKFKRKFDEDITNEMRILEELYYHSAQDSRYISELHNALIKTGIKADRTVQRKLKIKDSFKNTDFWKEGMIFLNERQLDSHINIFGIKDYTIDKKEYHYKLKTYDTISVNALDDVDGTINKNKVETKEKIFKLSSFGENVIRKAMSKISFYKFSNLKKLFPYLKSVKEFINNTNYLGDIEVTVTATQEQFQNLNNYQKLEIAIEILEEIKLDILSNKYEYKGSEEFKPFPIKSIFKDRIINITIGENQERGVPMSETSNPNFQLDLSNKEWYTHTENYGTDQEKLLVKFINNYIDELKIIYQEVYMHRNEKDFHIYSFIGGKRIEPDFVLFLRKKEDTQIITYQIFIEPKGEHILAKDKWKEEFLQSIESKAKIYEVYENKDFKLYGLPFYNKKIEKKFKKEFDRVTGI
jgi:type III restriction enzyme